MCLPWNTARNAWEVLNIISKEKLERLYKKYESRKYVHPDPLEFLYAYDDLNDREIAGLTASSLAYGRVAQILKSVSYVLDIMGPSPHAFLQNASRAFLRERFEGFRYRFAGGDNLAAMLSGAKQVIEQHGSLYECFLRGLKKNDETILPALSFFASELTRKENPGHLVPLPERGSACKRMNLFLRWMVRTDAVDPGGWEEISPSKLIVPLDVHMHKICFKLGLTARKQANMRTALEITSAFKKLAPDDPVRYDFALTRLGIRDDADPNDLFNL
ncbi:TIGR02757 family protein [Desulfonema magnum]|uniref:CHP02757 n=1 Tax=Desulfonema magnum TaxID=45655 RepID=A0A975GS60_9BACT|nr:TIGR02757 family protein [Desulfonema magnum]QTA91721.1 CHP02757 [Desulfonema magnum]